MELRIQDIFIHGPLRHQQELVLYGTPRCKHEAYLRKPRWSALRTIPPTAREATSDGLAILPPSRPSHQLTHQPSHLVIANASTRSQPMVSQETKRCATLTNNGLPQVKDMGQTGCN